MSRWLYNQIHKWSVARDIGFSGIELWNRSCKNRKYKRPDTINRQVDDPVRENLFLLYLNKFLSCTKFLLVYLIITCPTFSLSQAFSIVENGSDWTEAAFLQGIVTDRSKLGDIFWTLECSWRLYHFVLIFDGLAGFCATTRIVDKWCGAVEVEKKFDKRKTKFSTWKKNYQSIVQKPFFLQSMQTPNLAHSLA